MEFKELTVEELTQGFVHTEKEKKLVCIFCGETFDKDVIYQSGGRMLTAQGAMKEHLSHIHGGVFYGLAGLDKQINGLSDTQKELLEGMYLGKDNKELAEQMQISAATVRTHKFNIQKMKREAKILLAMLENIEEGRPPQEEQETRSSRTQPQTQATGNFAGNVLHPFFTQFNLK